jgi:hypothetical protein
MESSGLGLGLVLPTHSTNHKQKSKLQELSYWSSKVSPVWGSWCQANESDHLAPTHSRTKLGSFPPLCGSASRQGMLDGVVW